MTFARPRAGLYRESVVIVTDTDTPDGRGGQTTAAKVGTDRFPARVEVRERTKTLEGGGQVAFTEHIVSLRDGPSANILKEARFRWTNLQGDTVDLRILGAGTGERNRETKYACELVPADR